jgi:hypothetical protein
LPLSYRHYVYGMAYLARATARDTLQAAIAGRAAQTSKEEFKEFRRELRRLG